MDLTNSNYLVGYNDPIQMPVSELLTGTYHFTIPSYQRGYRWESGDGNNANEETKQVDDLLNDLTNFVIAHPTGKANYYLQPLMVKPRYNGIDWEWEVLDGQQRLTTMLLILKCLKEKLKQNNPLFTIRYDSRKQLDFGRITYEKSSSDYDYPVPNDNQDCYYVRKAKDRIEKWYDDVVDNNNGQLQDKLKEALLNPDASRGANPFPLLRAVFIWYNVEPASSNGPVAANRIHDIEVFNRLNRGKIGLTASELIKALFILFLKKLGAPLGSSLTIETLVRKWDDMGRKLQDDSLWKMISPRNKEYQNRLDLLFDFIRESDVSSKEKQSYLYYYKKMNSPTFTASDLETLWDGIKRHFDKLCKWHEDAHIHNYVGYLVECGKSISGINREIGTGATVTVLNNMAKQVLTAKGISFDSSGEPDLGYLNYKEHSDAVRKVLLLFNVVSCDKYGLKFPFDSYRDGSYDIEHVNSQTDNPIEKIEEKIEWVKSQAFPCLWEDRLEKDKATNKWTHAASIARDLIIEGVHLLKKFSKTGKDTRDEFKSYRRKVVSYYAYGNPNVSDATISADSDSIGNLTLLNSTINREYKNALYPNKLKTLKRCDQEGVYIPLCTKYLFLKYYTRTTNASSAFNMMRWRKEDQDDYLKAIQFTIKNALL